jgi:hypothetical protein
MSTTAPRPNLGLAMLKANLIEACDAVLNHDMEARQRRRQLIDDRNEMIVEMMIEGFPVTRLQQLTKLSRQQLYRIRGRRSDEE